MTLSYVNKCVLALWYLVAIALFTSLLTGCGKKKKIVQVLGDKLCGKKRRLCGNCAELCNCVNKQIFDHQAKKKPTWRNFWINESATIFLLVWQLNINQISILIKFIQNRNSRAQLNVFDQNKLHFCTFSDM